MLILAQIRVYVENVAALQGDGTAQRFQADGRDFFGGRVQLDAVKSERRIIQIRFRRKRAAAKTEIRDFVILMEVKQLAGQMGNGYRRFHFASHAGVPFLMEQNDRPERVDAVASFLTDYHRPNVPKVGLKERFPLFVDLGGSAERLNAGEVNSILLRPKQHIGRANQRVFVDTLRAAQDIRNALFDRPSLFFVHRRMFKTLFPIQF